MSIGAYLASLLAAWCGMGLFCLRAHAVRSRYGWPLHTAQIKRRSAIFASLVCLVSLGLALLATTPSFAIILCLVQLGVAGIAIALLLPYCTAWLPSSFRLAGLGAILLVAWLTLLH